MPILADQSRFEQSALVATTSAMRGVARADPIRDAKMLMNPSTAPNLSNSNLSDFV